MELRILSLAFLAIATVNAEKFKVCVPSASLCNTWPSKVGCVLAESSVECAAKMSEGIVDFGYFSGEELLLLAKKEKNASVVATVTESLRTSKYALEAVALVPVNHKNGFEGLKNGSYCHPGLNLENLGWSPRMLKSLERSITASISCPKDQAKKTSEKLEVESLSRFFSSGCRPGNWSANAVEDNGLKTEHTNLCSLCAENNCSNGYKIKRADEQMDALFCLHKSYAKGPAVAFSSWDHVIRFFTNMLGDPENVPIVTDYALLCPNGNLHKLTTADVTLPEAPCSFAKQPWGALVANHKTNAPEIVSSLMNWIPEGREPSTSSWEKDLFSILTGGQRFYKLNYITPQPVSEYTKEYINEDQKSCYTHRWCTISDHEQKKCGWLSAAASSLGFRSSITCHQAEDLFSCFQQIKDNKADFVTSSTDYGYLARQRYGLSVVKMVETGTIRQVIAVLKESDRNIGFQNLTKKNACFPEYGSLAHVAFVHTAQNLNLINKTELDYGKALGEFFSNACAPGAEEKNHDISTSGFKPNNTCTLCKSRKLDGPNCTIENSKYFDNQGALECLDEPGNNIAFLQKLDNELFGSPNKYKVLCKDNNLVDMHLAGLRTDCALVTVASHEVITRRQYNQFADMGILLDSLRYYFSERTKNIIDLKIFASFNGKRDLLFPNSVKDFIDPQATSVKEYIDLVRPTKTHHDEPSAKGFASRNFYPILTLVLLPMVTRLLF